MKSSYTVPILVAIVLMSLFLASGEWRSSSSLTVKFYGKEAANLDLMVAADQFDDVLTTNSEGTAYSKAPRGEQYIVFVPLPDGGSSQVTLPKYGNLTIDFQGDRTISREQVTYFGLFTSQKAYTSYTFSDEVSESLRNGQTTIEEVQQKIDEEVARQMTVEG